MSSVCVIATAVLNQWALDFDGNCKRIVESIKKAKLLHAKYRGGPELEVTGYGCGDHFYEPDTLMHSWEVLKKIIFDPECNDIMLDIGMPVGHRDAVYNCRVVALNGRIILIRPKQILATKEVYREERWFNSWRHIGLLEEYPLPEIIKNMKGQLTVPFGDAMISTNDCCLAIETCQELWAHRSPNIEYYLSGAEIIFNGNGSNHVLRKLDQRVSLIESATKKMGGVYVYTNLRGCDGERVYYDGGAMVAVNGEIVAQGQQFSLDDVEVVSATIDLEEVRTYRYRTSTGNVPNIALTRINVDFSLTNPFPSQRVSRPLAPVTISPEKEITLGPAFWLWDSLRRSGMNGFFLPLSGGLDSSSVACVVYSMCVEVVRAIHLNNEQVLSDLRSIVKDPTYTPLDPKQLCSQLLTTCYMGSENNADSSKSRAKNLAREINSTHLEVSIDRIIAAFLLVVSLCFNKIPRFTVSGGTKTENLALQNVQARIRMVLAYILAQLYLWSKDRGGSLLVLGSGNLDECLRGYLTKYDCSSADLNPIGSICKNDLKMFISYCIGEFHLTSLTEILVAPPTAELEPLKEGELCQTDEVDMGMTYAELSVYGKLRKIKCCGPYSMFIKLLQEWDGKSLSKQEIAAKVFHFFRSYSSNRHKMTVITPSYHVESYNCDDNRFDLRPYIYNVNWTWQFNRIQQWIMDNDSGSVT